MPPMRVYRQFQIAFLLALAAAAAPLAGCLGPAANRAPVASFVALPPSGYEPLEIQFDARASRDPDSDRLTYAWAFGDGGTARGSVVEHTFFEGTYTVALEVSDGRGGFSTATETVSAQAVPAGYVPRTFTWTSAGVARAETLLIPWDLYQMYKGRIRNTAAESYAYGDYVSDPLDDPTLEDYASVLWAMAGSVEEFVDEALAFAQGAIRYRADPVLQEWPWYPLETLVAGEGDCEDSAILFVSLLRARLVSSSLAFVDTDSDRLPDHILALVPVTPAWKALLSCQTELLSLGGVLYAVAETADSGSPIPLGCDPWNLSPEDIYEVWRF